MKQKRLRDRRQLLLYGGEGVPKGMRNCVMKVDAERKLEVEGKVAFNSSGSSYLNVTTSAPDICVNGKR